MEKRVTVEELLEKVKKPAKEAEEALKESDGDTASNNEVDGFSPSLQTHRWSIPYPDQEVSRSHKLSGS